MSKVCPCCGQRSLPVAGLGLTPLEWQIFETVRDQPGLTANHLRAAVWNEEDGGPSELSNLRARVCKMNRKLAQHGLAVHAERRGGALPRWYVYRLIGKAA